MLIKVGSCEAEVRVAAVMSTPRLGFTDNFSCVASALTPHGIPLHRVTGAFWGQCLTRAFEDLLDKADAVLVIDYDSVFTAHTVEALLSLLLWSGYDAIAPLQVKRESNSVMFTPVGHKPDDKEVVQDDWFGEAVRPVDTAHFGLTFIRTKAMKQMEKPWFLPQPNEKGEWNGGHVDEDLAFWRNFRNAGLRLGMATKVSIGHAELMITWPSRQVEGGKVIQHTTEYWNGGQKAPKEAWGHIG